MNETALAAKTPQVHGEIDALCRVADRFESLADRLTSKLSPVLRDPSPAAPAAAPPSEAVLVPVANAIKQPRVRLRGVAEVLDEILDRIEI